MKRFFFILPLVIALGASCADHDGTITGPEAAKRPDMVTEEAGVTARYFGADNPHAVRRVAETERSPITVSALETFRDAGYVYAREGSFTIEGEGAEGAWVEIVVLPMTPASGADDEAVYILCVGGPAGERVIPLHMTAREDLIDGAAYPVGDGGWIGIAGAAAGASGCNSAARLDLTGWLQCLGDAIGEGLQMCGTLCPLGPMRLSCLVTCGVGVVMQAFASCTIMQS